MTREEYIDLVREGNENYIIYEYFIEKSRIPVSPEIFGVAFSKFLNDIAQRNLLDGNSLLEVCKKVAISHFDYKFEIIYCENCETEAIYIF